MDEKGEWRRLYNVNFTVCTVHIILSNIICVIKSRGLKWACHTAGTKAVRSALNILKGKLTGKTPFLEVDGRTI